MHFRRNRARSHGKRSSSSDWHYPQVDRGKAGLSRPANKRRAAAANEEAKIWDPADPSWDYHVWTYGYWDYVDGQHRYPGDPGATDSPILIGPTSIVMRSGH